MPRLAVISDIHGNLPALEAVLADLSSLDLDEVLIGGDLVGRGPQGSAVVGRLKGLGWPAIQGNHEEYLLDFRRGTVAESWLVEEEWAASRWMAAELSDSDVAFIEALPFDLRRPGFRLVHGTPRSNREGIGPWTGDDELAGHYRRVPEELLVCAHTHRPLVRSVDGGQVVNVGSVGLPFNRDQRAQYAVFTREAAGEPWQVELRQVEYDVEETLAIYRRSGFLAEGGITARLLYLELEHAVPLLVPFLEWARMTGRRPSLDELESFLAFHRPGASLREFFQRLRAQVG